MTVGSNPGLLSDQEIAWALDNDELDIEPAIIREGPDKQLQPASVDLRLGDRFTRFKPWGSKVPPSSIPAIDPRDDVSERMDMIVEPNRWRLNPGDFVLGHTIERVRLSRSLTGCLDGRSSIGRLGVLVHLTAGYIDPGFKGQITLELFNAGSIPVYLFPGRRICQIRFYRMASEARNPYAGKYQGDIGAVPSRIHEDGR